MSMPVQEQTSSAEQAGVLNKNTGFPEPLSIDRNTTLTHPDADTSTSASIEAADISLSRTQSRIHVHLPGFHRHGSKSGSSAKLVTDPSELYKDIQYADGSTEERSVGEVTEDVQQGDGEGKKRHFFRKKAH